MADEIDLDNPPDDETPSERRRRIRRSERGTSKDSSSDKKASTGLSDSTVRGKLGEAFVKLGRQLESKGDEELASAILEEKDGMSQGLMSLTSSVTFLRGPLVLLVEVALVILAFWRVGSILLRRLIAQRERIMFERAQYETPDDVPPQGAPIPEGAVVR